jgi:hypothetical protein
VRSPIPALFPCPDRHNPVFKAARLEPFADQALAALKLAPVNGFVLPDDATLRGLLSSHAMINTIVINAAMLFYALTALHRAGVKLQDQYEHSEALIETVMPTSIAMCRCLPISSALRTPRRSYRLIGSSIFLDGLVRTFRRSRL